MMVISVIFAGAQASGPNHYLFGGMGQSISALGTKIVGELIFAAGTITWAG